MHHKRKGPRSTRAGCLMCKPHKRQGVKLSDRVCGANFRRLMAASTDLRHEGLARFDKGVR
jgi:hypothetical protein